MPLTGGRPAIVQILSAEDQVAVETRTQRRAKQKDTCVYNDAGDWVCAPEAAEHHQTTAQ